jgi:hypothetical protein
MIDEIADVPSEADAQQVMAFTAWQATQPRIVHHQFVDQRLEFLVEDSGWLSAEETPQTAQQRYWLARDAFPYVDAWPRQIKEVHAGFPLPGAQAKIALLVSETVNNEEVLRLSSREEIRSSRDLRVLIAFYEICAFGDGE